MDKDPRVEERLVKIQENLDGNQIWEHMKGVASDLFKSLKSYNIVRKIELNPNDMKGGSVNFYFNTLPKTVSIKLFHESGNYYMSFFRKMENTFDQQLTGIFKDGDVVTLVDLDKFEEMILDFCSNEIFNRDNKSEIVPD